MRWTGVLLLVALLAVGACGGNVPSSGDESDAARMLPDAYYGTWVHTATGGGLDGQGIPLPEGPPATLVLARENTWSHRGADGQVTSRRFTARKEKTIFSAEPQWTIAFATGEPVLVLQLVPDGELVASENVYDGFSTSYRRAPSSR